MNCDSDSEPLIVDGQKSEDARQSIASANAATDTQSEISGLNLIALLPAESKQVLVRHTPWRWVMLTFGCFFLMGNTFSFDNPAPLKHTLQTPPFSLTDSQWSGLYSIYSFPNMIMPLLGGIFIDRIGIR